MVMILFLKPAKQMQAVAADIEITVNKELQAEASSGGDVNYKGNASITNVSNSSGGRIKKQS